MEKTHGALAQDDYIAAVAENSALLADAARRGLRVPVPTCPGWSVATLVAHIGEVQHYWAHLIVERARTPLDLPADVWDTCPGLRTWYEPVSRGGSPDLDAIPRGLIEWFEGATAALVAAFRAIEPETAVWHWSGDNRAIVHMRNQAMEATVHRWDAQKAHGATTSIDPRLALDGIEQHFQVQVPATRRWTSPAPGRGETYHFHRTDGAGEWLVRFDGHEVRVEHVHAKGDVALRGAAEELFLWLWGRLPADRLAVFGDRSLRDRYRQLVPPN